MPITVRGAAQVVWKPAWTLVLTSVDGLSLESDGEDHTLIATLTESATGNPIIGKLLRLNTSPRGEVGDRVQRYTDGAGQVRFTVSNTDDESVDYTVLVPPKGTMNDSLTIVWGPPLFYDFLFTCPVSNVALGTNVEVTGFVTIAGTSDPADGVFFDLTYNPGAFLESGTGGGPGLAKLQVQLFAPLTILFEANSISVPAGGVVVVNTPCSVTWS